MFRSSCLIGALLTVICCVNGPVAAQSTMPESEPWTPGTAEEPTEEKSGWLFNSPLMNVGWPKMQLPSLTKNKETGEPGMFTGPITKMQSATRQAATRTRDAWNGTIDRVKMRLPGGSDGTAVAKEEPKQHFWSSWFGEEKATDEPADMLAREPSSKTR